ncbi:MerR family transcriptional regulator [Lactiplantibacillus herbarum]|uniref:MerR family transcriptional regulator n=1 Tax=Lactiplantibacillus herbarum TaxID=1670446 RepID=UPI00064FF63D|nr:MerR family transcriptional regulator [Lactiplantibacillus herbarum]
MTYQIKQLAILAGVSVRTLRYYDEIGLLKPAFVGENGYRYYENEQVDRLQQICLYRTMELPLAEIPALLDQPMEQVVTHLQQQYQHLQRERQRLDQLLAMVQTTIQTQRESSIMTDEEKFQTFKVDRIATNEQQYGDEIREQYGESTVTEANRQFADLSATDYAAMQTTEQRLLTILREQLNASELDVEAGTTIYQLHRQWLSYTWPKYTAAMHRGLATMYLADDRFREYYDSRAGQGATVLLVEAIEQQAQD